MAGVIKMLTQMNGLKVTKRGETYFVALPPEVRRPIAGGCQCSYCKAHLDKLPTWDTLAIGADSPHAWTVHYPEVADA